MRIYPLLLIAFIASCQSKPEERTGTGSDQQPLASDQVEQEAEPFAVVELFTSEGCSDCPPAEELLNKITREAMANKTYVYPLAFHVDYWNKLGWKDVFSDSAYSNRQRRYRTAFGNEVVYTPQMIVNGRTEFVGSDSVKSKTVIDSVLNIKPDWFFTIHPDESKLETGEIATDFEVIERPAGEESNNYHICFALVERNLESHISRGENKGLKLVHENIVRYFKAVKLGDLKGQHLIQYAPGKIGKNHSLIVFIQNAENMKIVGANLWNF